MWLRDFRRQPTRVAELLFWDALLTPSLVIQKDGGLLSTLHYRGPDVEACVAAELVTLSAKLNNLFKRFGAGWGLFSEARRRPVAAYPATETWPDPLSARLDAERATQFTRPDTQYVTETYLSLVYRQPHLTVPGWRQWVYEHLPPETDEQTAMQEMVAAMVTQTQAMLRDCCPQVSLLEGDALLTYLHSTISTHTQPVAVPSPPCYLDTYLSDQDVLGGIALQLGGQHVRCLSVRHYPSETFPGMFDALNILPVAYRACLRYLPMAPQDALYTISKAAHRWHGKRTDGAGEDQGALDNYGSLLQAQASAQHGHVNYGALTATVVVWDADLSAVQRTAHLVEHALQQVGCVVKVETLNALAAWCGTHPGNTYSNVRRPLMHSLNLAHLLPCGAPWQGQAWNAHLNGPPLVYAIGRGQTPVGVSLHEGDVGHVGVIGATGDGKSTALNLLCAQHLRYPRAEVVIFDKMYAARKLTAAVGGLWYDLGAMPLQPLAALERPGEVAWAVDWLEALLLQEHVTIRPAMKAALYAALTELATWETGRRTLTSLVELLPASQGREALRLYTREGPYGLVTDGDRDGIGAHRWLCFEMGGILETPRLLGAILPALFHRLEQRLTGPPILYVLHEGWVALDTPYWADRLRGWLKGLRTRNGQVLLATQSLADAVNSPMMPALLDNVATWILTPNARAQTEEIGQYYRAIGLNERQRELLAHGTKKRDYYILQGSGQGMVQLNLGPLALAFCGTSDPQEVREVEAVVARNPDGFVEQWLAKVIPEKEYA